MTEAEILVARADKYLNTGSGEYAGDILRDMAEFVRRINDAATPASDRTAWLIEVSEPEGPEYFQLVDDDNWSSDHDTALQFARKEDAEKYIADVGWTRARAVEHMWPSTAQRTFDKTGDGK